MNAMDHSGRPNRALPVAQDLNSSQLYLNLLLRNNQVNSSLNFQPAPSSSSTTSANPITRYPAQQSYPSPNTTPSTAAPDYFAIPLSATSSHSQPSSPWQAYPMASPRDEFPSARRQSDLRSTLTDLQARDSITPPRSNSPLRRDSDDNGATTSEFVRKLYKMLEDNSHPDTVSWTPRGDAFVVKDMNEFSMTILPRLFKHSNFASFVRQLNKYDFHKVRCSDDDPFGEHSWTFRHPYFRSGRREALENIKRKVPNARKGSSGHMMEHSTPAPVSLPVSILPNPQTITSASVEALQADMSRMELIQEEMAAHIRHLEENYQSVLSEMVNLQRSSARQDGLMQNLLEYFLLPDQSGQPSLS